MIVLKILLWIIIITAALIVLAQLLVLLALSVKIQLGFDYDEDGIRFRVKYGFFGLKIYPELFEEEKMDGYKRKFYKLKRKFGPKVSKIFGKVQNKAEQKKEMHDIEKDLKKQEEFKEEEAKIKKEEIKLEEQEKKVGAEEANAIAAENAGTPLPDVIDESQVSKLDSIRESLDTFDFEGAYNSAKSFFSGFNFDSIMALLSYIGKQTSHTMGKVVHRIIIKQFCVGLTVGGNDAAKTAIKYGTISSIAFPAMGKMVNSMNIRQYDIEVNPDFLSPKDHGELHTIIAFRPIRLATPFIGYLLKVGNKSVSFYRSSKKGMKAQSSSNKKSAKKVKN